MSMARKDPTDSAQAADVLKGMWSIRVFEEAVEELFSRGLLHGTMHLTIGQEAVAEGVCDALDEGDFITSTHRGHGHALAHGADPERMLAELLMKDTGYCRGRGGSMHIADVDSGNLGANGIVAGSMTIATGAALSQRLQETGKVVVCFFGDGAANEGAFHEALNLASIWSLPLVFACENNQYGMSMAQEKSTAGGSVANRASAYGMPGVQVNGNDVVEVFENAREAVEHARSGEGPSLLEFVTYRYRGHSKSDRNLYRTQQEIDQWRSTKDPLMLYEQRLRSLGWLDDEEIAAAQLAARERIREAVVAAYKAPPALVDDLEGAAYA
ncbi:MAG: pyruvate dehydrogenase (acetyl-transferring) E1 component subunit alpha [Gammaproteobacteria bacterium]|nr:pyruvate dehydrogenase (acetyl-transferring) E1 component subunit alpha [Gammaproteobacteria bacterium]